MNFFEYSSCSPSTFCSSCPVPRVTTTRACVSPRWNTADPCVRGKRPTSLDRSRITSSPRPSIRVPVSVISWKMRSFRAEKACEMRSGLTVGFLPLGRGVVGFLIWAFNSSSAA